MKKNGVVLALLIIAASTAAGFADVPRGDFVVTSANGAFVLERIGRFQPGPDEEWSLRERASGYSRYSLQANLTGTELLLSDDGRTVVSIRTDPGLPASEEWSVLRLFRDGTQIANYTLGDIGFDIRFAVRSVSHFSWVALAPVTVDTRDRPVRLTATELTVVTTDLRRHTFALETGSRVSNTLLAEIPAGALLAYGEAALSAPPLPGSRRLYRFVPSCVLAGSATKGEPIEFAIAPPVSSRVPLARRLQAVVLANEPTSGLFMLRAGELLDAWEYFGQDCDNTLLLR